MTETTVTSPLSKADWRFPRPPGAWKAKGKRDPDNPTHTITMPSGRELVAREEGDGFVTFQGHMSVAYLDTLGAKIAPR